jgi:hypothetical protein
LLNGSLSSLEHIQIAETVCDSHTWAFDISSANRDFRERNGVKTRAIPEVLFLLKCTLRKGFLKIYILSCNSQ